LLNDYITLLCWDQQYTKASGQPGQEDQLHADTLRLLAANCVAARNLAMPAACMAWRGPVVAISASASSRP
jgi:hypothetical protein